MDIKNNDIAKKTKEENGAESKKSQYVFGAKNYIALAIGFAVLVIGYLLMMGGGSDDPNTFNPEIFNTRRITVAPIVLIIGFAIEIFAIMWRPRSKNND
ncbi:MAG: DUF3098 domain-containing protein [Bacteroidales bacterium]|nr:DUF3098 domain-containing protein [Bacteroidales bacterium]